MKTAALTLAALLMLGYAAQAQTDPVAGTWKLKGKVQTFGFTLTCRFTRSGDTLGGTCFDGGTNKAHPLKSGRVTGDKVVWTYGSDFMGQKFDVTYSGVVKGGAISGEVDAAGRKGSFSGAR
ncbi:MAG: hypothetical protein EON95_19550 [Caulobacteraceae bacterium]|nr:MAG: hypothetical protein EON95_19550 [Caulobacteraceae bacterium]